MKRRGDVVDHIERALRLRWAVVMLRMTGDAPADPTPFPRLHLFPRMHRACRPARRLGSKLGLYR